MNYYLLAYPRSGSSLARAFISAITAMRPAQPDDSCELQAICGRYVIPQRATFHKYHYKGWNSTTITDDYDNVLLQLIRDPVENIPSYVFSERFVGEGINHRTFTEEEYIQFFQEVDQETWDRHIFKYCENLQFYEDWQNKKARISYEAMVTDPHTLYKIKLLSAVRTNVDFDFIAAEILKYKTSHADQLKVHTAGKKLRWFHNLLPVHIKTRLEEIRARIIESLLREDEHITISNDPAFTFHP